MSAVAELQRCVCAANLDLAARGLVLGTWGNVSGVDRQAGLVGIKPSGVAYAELQPDMIVVTDLAGRVVRGELRPSSDLPTHLELYRAWGGVGGVAHTHSLSATAFAQACRPLPCLGTTHADYFRGAVPVTRDLRAEETAVAYETNTGRVIVETFLGLDPLDMPAVLVASHGPFTWGVTCAEAVWNSVALEAVARLALDTLALADVPALSSHLLDRHFKRKHGPGAYYGQRQ
jgi:L-ribulose-5-phosphate 4-epimerase